MNLAKTAMLVSVTIVNGGLLGERKDATASALVENTYQVTARRAKASKYLIDRKAKVVKRVVAASQRVREVVYRYSTPWGDEKMRLLPVATSEEFRRKLNTALVELEEAREDYIHAYPALVAASERDLGELFDRSQYPTPDKVRELFKTSVTYWPMPESGHFVADISDKAAKEAKESIEREIENRLLDATYDLVKRARTVVSELIEKLETVKMEGRELKGVIRDSLADNIADTASLIERLNLTENREINNVVRDLRRLERQVHPAYWRQQPWAFGEGKAQALGVAKEIMMNLVRLDLKDQEIDQMIHDTSDYME